MQLSDVLERLESLPATFTRNGPNYGYLQSAIAAALSRYTTSQDDTNAQESINVAGYRWLDCFGLLYGIPRFSGAESSVDYLARIEATLVSARGTPVAIEQYLALITGLGVSVEEDTAADNYSITLTGAVSAALLARVNSGIGFVRPAGVPFMLDVAVGGLFMSTINYGGRGRVTGAYLINSSNTTKPNIAANTNSALPGLPTDYLTDPSLNSSS
jgi:hypothetical protein